MHIMVTEFKLLHLTATQFREFGIMEPLCGHPQCLWATTNYDLSEDYSGVLGLIQGLGFT